MKSFVAFFAVIAFAAADVLRLSENYGSERNAEIVSQKADVFPDQFEFSFQTSNGITGEARGRLEKIGNEDALRVTGANSYVAPDNQQISLTYTADENGYNAYGAHLPTPPAPIPIPDYILRAIEYIRTHPPKPENKQ